MKRQGSSPMLIIFVMMISTYFCYGLVYTQLIPYMESLAMDVAARGTLFSVSAVFGIVAQFYTGYLSDKYQGLKEVTIVIHVLFAIAAWFGYVDFHQITWLYFINIGIGIGFYRIGSNLIETWMYEVDENTQKKFGIIRIFGSLGWAIGAYLVANIINQFGYQGIGHAIALLMILNIGLMTLIPSTKKNSTHTGIKMSDVRKLFANRQFVLILVIYFWIFLVFGLSGLTVIDRMVELSSTAAQIGSYWSLQAVFELPFLLFGGWIINKFGGKKVLIFATLMMLVRFTFYGLATTSNQIIVISLLQAVTFPLILLTQKMMVAQQTPLHLRSSGHMIMTAITANIPIIILPILAGYLSLVVPFSTILLVGGLSCILPLALSFFYHDKKGNN